jgi:hypothetical protein
VHSTWWHVGPGRNGDPLCNSAQGLCCVSPLPVTIQGCEESHRGYLLR